MAVPKKKTSHSKTRMRKANKGLKKVNLVVDATTGEVKLPHHVSLQDGYYNGRQVITPKVKSDDEEDESLES